MIGPVVFVLALTALVLYARSLPALHDPRPFPGSVRVSMWVTFGSVTYENGAAQVSWKAAMPDSPGARFVTYTQELR